MKNVTIYLVLGCSLFSGCEKAETFSESKYECTAVLPVNVKEHPKAQSYQAILDRNQKQGLVGASLMIRDENGVWFGSSGKADIASNVGVSPCHRFLIASISKVFTATVIFRYVDRGLLNLDDNIGKWLPNSIIHKLQNAESAKISHLLNHTSGIADYYTTKFELDRINKVDNNWMQEDILSYAYNQAATHGLGETYSYSNTNFLLLGMILERVSGDGLSQIYSEEIFNPLSLTSAYFSATNTIPDNLVKGYADIFGNGQFVESEFLYKDELSTADGGIAINAYDLGMFFENLMKGNILTDDSLEKMTDWFDLPPDWVDEDYGHFQNGFGLEYNRTPYGNSVGHTGGIDGYQSIAQYFPEADMTFVLLVNSVSSESEARTNIYNQVLEKIFDQ